MVTLKSRIWKLKSRNRILLLLACLLSLTTILWAQGEFKARKIVSSTALELQAGGTNQNITLTPSGTGYTILNGYVGIGTTAPAVKLDVAGGAGNDSVMAIHRQSADKYGSGLYVYKRGTTGDANAAVASGTELGYHSFYGWDGTAYGRGAYALAKTTQAWTATGHGTAYQIATTPNDSTTNAVRLTVDQSGYVGIGITSPGKALDVSGDIRASGQLISGLNIVTFSATPTFDASLGNTQKITLTANVTSSTLSNASTGQAISFIICQDATGGRTFVWPTNVLGGMAIGSTASKCSAQNFIFDGTNAYALSAGVSNM
jgi:hypothetical protein